MYIVFIQHSLTHRGFSMNVGCLLYFPRVWPVTKNSYPVPIPGLPKILTQNLIGQPIRLPEIQPSQFPWHKRSIQSSYCLQQRDLANSVMLISKSERGKDFYLLFSSWKPWVFSITNTNAHTHNSNLVGTLRRIDYLWFAENHRHFTALRKIVARLKKVPYIPNRSVKKACPQKLKR